MSASKIWQYLTIRYTIWQFARSAFSFTQKIIWHFGKNGKHLESEDQGDNNSRYFILKASQTHRSLQKCLLIYFFIKKSIFSMKMYIYVGIKYMSRYIYRQIQYTHIHTHMQNHPISLRWRKRKTTALVSDT